MLLAGIDYGLARTGLAVSDPDGRLAFPLATVRFEEFPDRKAFLAAIVEKIRAAGAEGVMLNHAEKPLSFEVLKETVRRAREVGLKTIVCADSSAEAAKIAQLAPDIIVAEPTELIGSGVTVGPEYVQAAVSAVRDVNPDIKVLVGAGISGGQDVYSMMIYGSDATGTSSAVCKAADRRAMVDEMIAAVRRGWNDFHQQKEEPK